MPHVEEREFTLRVVWRTEFADGYDGDEDYYAWTESVPARAAEVVRAAMAQLAQHAGAGWKVRPSNRGRPAEDEVTLLVERTLR